MNIVFVMSDTFRYDNLSCYGPTRVKTPRLDQFAGQAYVFDNAYLSTFPTIPNRLDIMSGRFSFIDYEWGPLPADTVTLQQILSASGVVTGLIMDNPHMVEMGFNYERGFDTWEWIRGQETDLWRKTSRPIKMPPRPETYQTREFILRTHLNNTAWWRSEEDRFAPRSIQTACRWLDDNQDQEQFFLWIDLFDPHEPWDAPKNYIDLYAPNYRGPEVAYPDYCFWEEYFSEEEMDEFRVMYMAETSMIDHWFGVLLDKIEELGLTEDTAVIFASDHGYLLGEHGLFGKSLHLRADGKSAWEAVPMYDEIRRIPLMVRMPEQQEGRHLKALVQSPDLMPTILEMAGLVATEVIEGKSQIQTLQCGVFFSENWQFRPETVHGKSLMPLLQGGDDRHRDIAVASNTLIYHTPILAKSAIITEDGWCLHHAGQYRETAPDASLAGFKVIQPEAARISYDPALYYLPDDPKEGQDVIGENSGLAQEIHRRYVAWLEEAGTPEEHLGGRRNLQ